VVFPQAGILPVIVSRKDILGGADGGSARELTRSREYAIWAFRSSVTIAEKMIAWGTYEQAGARAADGAGRREMSQNWCAIPVSHCLPNLFQVTVFIR
jgi:hypothetical protein